jgi:thioredoxin 1
MLTRLSKLTKLLKTLTICSIAMYLLLGMTESFALKGVSTQSQLNQIIKTHSVVLIDFGADWCENCTIMEGIKKDPIVIKSLQNYFQVKVDLTLNTLSKQKICSAYGVIGLPTYIIIINGKVYDREVGAVPTSLFLNFLNRH